MSCTVSRWPRLGAFARSSGYRRRWRRLRAKRLLLDATEGRVYAGPFAGMQYIRRAVGSAWAPKLLGTYELEIHDAVGEAVRLGPDLVVNLGAAEGYYAVALARALPASRVIAYEASVPAHRLIERLSRQNGVADRLEIRGLATPQSLAADLARASAPLVVCDVDGGELKLLDPSAVPALARAAILVELHDTLCGLPITETIRERFAESHEIRHYRGRPRVAADLPAGIRLPRRFVKLALSERAARAEDWFWMLPRCQGR